MRFTIFRELWIYAIVNASIRAFLLSDFQSVPSYADSTLDFATGVTSVAVKFGPNFLPIRCKAFSLEAYRRTWSWSKCVTLELPCR